MSTDHQAYTSGQDRRKHQDLLDRSIACYLLLDHDVTSQFSPSSGYNGIGMDTDTVWSLMTPQTLV